ncbi:MAG: NTP transferase domain-containing protein [Steroidobacteraceae bacterium]|jgi:molybdopterin-guanine dinucleotide biosynthesis protein A|nr:NTP transferase domain-containing protein [Steroidobacteraceae bacterium]
MSPALFGLVLAGGASTRMQRDKATLQYHGKSQLEWAFDLLSEVCAATFVSVRPEQRDEPLRARFPQIVDRQPGAGPIAGISAALQEHPRAAWLVVACDLPFLTSHVLQHLIAHRDPQRIATAYRSAHDGLPEPLCAIWEPSAREAVLAHLAAGKQCPRKLLIASEARLLDLPDPRALDNINTVEEFGAASTALGAGANDQAPSSNAGKEADEGSSAAAPSRDQRPVKTVRVQYFAILREQAGCSEETLDTAAGTPAELYEELRSRHPFKLAPTQLKVALNSEFSDWRANLRHGDTIVFIPPVAGG